MSLRELQQIEKDRINEEERAARRAVQQRLDAERRRERALEKQRKKQEQMLRELEVKARAEAEARARVEAEAELEQRRLEIELARATAVPETLPSPVIPEPPRTRLAWIVSAILAIALVAQGAALWSMMDDNDQLESRVTELRAALASAASAIEPDSVAEPSASSPMEPARTADLPEPDRTGAADAEPDKPTHTGRGDSKPPRDRDDPKPDHRIQDKCAGSTDPFCGMR